MAETAKKNQKEDVIIVDLRKRVKLKVTKKGAEMKINNWKENQIIEVGADVMAEYFIKNGVAVEVK